MNNYYIFTAWRKTVIQPASLPEYTFNISFIIVQKTGPPFCISSRTKITIRKQMTTEVTEILFFFGFKVLFTFF